MNFNKKTIFFISTFIIIFSPILYLHFNKAKSLGWNNLIRITVSFIKNSIKEPKLKNAQSLPSKFEQFSKIFNFFINANKPTPAEGYITEKIGPLKYFTHNYWNFFPVYNEIFVEKIYYFETDSTQPFIIDCGSNVGTATLFFKLLYPNSKILAFEPSSASFKLLEKNVKINNLKNISLFQKALTDKNGTVKIYRTGGTACRINDENYYSLPNEIVDTTQLSNYINQPVDLLKMDVEGSETLILQNLDQNKKLDFVKKIILEYHHYPHKNFFVTKNSLPKILKILEKNNFAYQIQANTETIPFKESKDEKYLLIFAYKNKS